MLLSKSVLACLASFIALCSVVSARWGEDVLLSMTQAIEHAGSRDVIQYSANMREIGFRVNTPDGPQIVTLPGDATVGDVNSSLAKLARLGKRCYVQSHSKATVPEAFLAGPIFSEKDNKGIRSFSGSLGVETGEDDEEGPIDDNYFDEVRALMILKCEKAGEYTRESGSTEQFILRPALYFDDFIPKSLKKDVRCSHLSVHFLALFCSLLLPLFYSLKPDISRSYFQCIFFLSFFLTAS